MMTFGYARCSTNEDKQDINRQIRELKAAGADEIIFEYEHGDSKVKKQQTQMIMKKNIVPIVFLKKALMVTIS